MKYQKNVRKNHGFLEVALMEEELTNYRTDNFVMVERSRILIAKNKRLSFKTNSYSHAKGKSSF